MEGSDRVMELEKRMEALRRDIGVKEDELMSYRQVLEGDADMKPSERVKMLMPLYAIIAAKEQQLALVEQKLADALGGDPAEEVEEGETGTACVGKTKSSYHSVTRLISSSINVRFLEFEWHFILALGVLLTTVGLIFLVASELKRQCIEVCSSGPLAVIKPGPDYLCRSYSIEQQLSTTVADVRSLASLGYGDIISDWYQDWDIGFFGQTQTFCNLDYTSDAASNKVVESIRATKCSWQFKENCGVVEWANWIQGLAALRHALDPTTERYIPFPSLGNMGLLVNGQNQSNISSVHGFMRDEGLLMSTSSRGIEATTAGDWKLACVNVTNPPIGCTPYRVSVFEHVTEVISTMRIPIWSVFPQHRQFPAGQPDTLLFKAPSDAACCDILYNTEEFDYASSVVDSVSWGTVKIRSSSLDGVAKGDNLTCTTSSRCSYVEVTAKALPALNEKSNPGPMAFKDILWDFCNYAEEGDVNSTISRQVLVTACQYLYGGGAEARFCLNATVPIFVGVLAETRLCRVPFCLKDPRIMVYRLDDKKWIPFPSAQYSIASGPSNIIAKGTNFLLSNGQPVCSLCPELCVNGKLADLSVAFPDASTLLDISREMEPQWYIEGLPETMVKGKLIDAFNVSGTLPENTSVWAGLSHLAASTSLSPLNPHPDGGPLVMPSYDAMYGFMLAMAEADPPSLIELPYITQDVTYEWLLLQYLLPAAHDFGLPLASMLLRQDPDHGQGEVSSMWNEKQLYCCHDECPSWLAAVGNALGYYTHVEMLVAALGVLVYLVVRRKEAKEKGMTTMDVVRVVSEYGDGGEGEEPQQNKSGVSSRVVSKARLNSMTASRAAGKTTIRTKCDLNMDEASNDSRKQKTRTDEMVKDFRAGFDSNEHPIQGGWGMSATRVHPAPSGVPQESNDHGGP